MCDHHAHRAISLDHGEAHDQDHAAWTRRDFLFRAGLGAAAAASAPMWVGSAQARAVSGSPLLDALARTETDRVLVLVQLQGGNDGLNTVVPFRDSLYYGARPSLAIARGDTHEITTDAGLHPQMGDLMTTWADGDLAIVQGVGYPSSSLSHFRGTDVWLTADEDVAPTGWAGRTLGLEHPDPQTAPPDVPPAVQMGTSAPLLFNSGAGGLGMALLDVELFLQIAEGGELYSTTDVPPGAPGAELAFVRSVANDAFRYRDAIQTATNRADNDTTYPDSRLGSEMAAVARLIKGRLGSRIYLVSLGGFDTHANQPDEHAALLLQLSQALVAFYADLAATDDAQRTLAVTFSEFGRRVYENGSNGTDHGTAAPLFLFGPAASGGLYGSAPDLGRLDDGGNVAHETDFRQIYATILRDWFGLDAATAADVLGGEYTPLSVLDGTSVSTAPTDGGPTLRLGTPSPNPVRHRAEVTYRLPEAGHVTLSAFDTTGRLVAQIAEGPQAAGEHRATFDASSLAPGVYVLRLETPGGARTVRATVVR
ncbi:MAG: DUF1501 domain-containing protein [Bacteroidota bacterium]